LLILNTTLESLAQGVPMVAIPIAFDQPGISARIAHHGVGEFVDLENLSVDNLLELIRKVLTNRSYVERAHYFKEVIAKTRGLEIAAGVIDQAFETPKAQPIVASITNVEETHQ
jgi:zeaxanthin glucosyltransferase